MCGIPFIYILVYLQTVRIIMKTKIVILYLVSLIAFSCSKDNESESAISRFVNSTWAFYTENSKRAYYKYDFTSTTSGKYWYYKGTDNTNKFDFTYTADNLNSAAL